MEQKVFTEKEAAFYLRVSRSYLAQDRMNGKLPNRTQGPRFIKFGKSIRYLREDLDNWLQQFRQDQ
tara:strand:+ start:2333 stop:2530 length:198 start_codon:yes stop_codon:yes gene_type:complete